MDVAKGILIIMVIVGHIAANSKSKYGIESQTLVGFDEVCRLYTCFFMQAFFLITGYCTNFNIPFKSFLIKSAKTLLLPAFSFAIICKSVDAIFLLNVAPLLSFLRPGCWIYGFYLYWFLYALFIARIVYWMINKVVKSNYLIFSILLVLMVMTFVVTNEPIMGRVFPDYFWWPNAIINMFFLGLGVMLKGKLDNWWLLGFGCGAYFVSVVTLLLLNQPLFCFSEGYRYFSYWMIPEFILLATGGSLLILTVSKLISKSKILEYFGRESLIMYCVHSMFLNFSIWFVFNYMISPYNTFTTGFFIFFVTIFTCCLSYVATKIMHTKYLYWMLGK